MNWSLGLHRKLRTISHQSRFPRRPLVVILILVTLASLSLVLVPRQLIPSASAVCSVGNYSIVSGRENVDAHLKGSKANIFVNSFDSAQCKSWRATAIIKNNCNLAETGWISRDGHGYSVAPFKTWYVAANCAYHHDEFWNQPLSLGVNHEFKVHDNNGDQWWSFAVDGSALPGGMRTFPSITGMRCLHQSATMEGTVFGHNFATYRNVLTREPAG